MTFEATDARQYLDEGNALTARGEFDEADILLEKAIKALPGDEALKVAHAGVARERRDWPEVCHRWQHICECHPANPRHFAEWAAMLQHSGRHEEAAEVLTSAAERFPAAAEILETRVHLSHTRGAWKEATDLWQDFRTSFPDHASGYAGGAEALRALQRFEEAEVLLEGAPALLQQHPLILLQRARTSTSVSDWQTALDRWVELLDRYPDMIGLDAAIGEFLALWQLACAENDAAAVQAMVPKALRLRLESQLEGNSPKETARQLMLQFESLGDHCEFGLVQRHFEAEPLSLLRWSSITPENLANALAERFGGVGEPDNTYVKATGPNGEYFAGDKRWFFMHTFIRTTNETEEQVFRKSCTRLRYLKDRLLENLDEGEKIFIYKRHIHAMEQSQCDDLVRAIEDGYPNAPFCIVLLADSQHHAGMVEKVGNNVYYGYLDRSNNNLSAEHVSYDCWLKICSNLSAATNSMK